MRQGEGGGRTPCTAWPAARCCLARSKQSCLAGVGWVGGGGGLVGRPRAPAGEARGRREREGAWLGWGVCVTAAWPGGGLLPHHTPPPPPFDFAAAAPCTAWPAARCCLARRKQSRHRRRPTCRAETGAARRTLAPHSAAPRSTGRCRAAISRCPVQSSPLREVSPSEMWAADTGMRRLVSLFTPQFAIECHVSVSVVSAACRT